MFEMYETTAGKEQRLARQRAGWFDGWTVVDTETISGIVYKAVKEWLKVEGNIGRVVAMQTLYTEAQELLEPQYDSLPREWPRSANWFGRKLTMIEQRLQARHGFLRWHSENGQMCCFIS